MHMNEVIFDLTPNAFCCRC